MKQLPPWLEEAWQRLEALERQDRMPHGVLLTGPAGIGLEHLADALALHALGEQGGKFPELKSHALAHADLRLVEPESGKASLSVETIRELDTWLHLTPQLVGRKVVVMGEAHRMTRAASNAFLKTLEEPPLGSLLILLTHAPARLLPTIRSRVQRIEAKAPSQSASVAWISARHEGAEQADIERYLFEAGGAPLIADRALFRAAPLLGPMLIDALKGCGQAKLVDVLCDLDADTWLAIWMRYCAAGMRPKSTALGDAHLNPDHIWRFWCRLTEARRMLHEGVALNARLTAGNLVAERSGIA